MATLLTIFYSMACFCNSNKLLWMLAACLLVLTCRGVVFAMLSEEQYACAAPFAHLPFCNSAHSVEVRVADLLARLSLKEKINQLVSNSTSISRLGIPEYYWWAEALHGLSDNGPGVRFGNAIPSITTFPQVILTAASFNRTLWNLIAQAVSTEARAMYNVGQAGLTYWCPNINIFRDPRWGRGQETPGEDPFLSSEYAMAYVSGLQGQEYDEDASRFVFSQNRKNAQNAVKVAACCKHFTAYDLEAWGGYTRYTFDALVTQQDLADTYNPPFKSCVQDAQAMCVMCSYNRVNGIPSCADSQLLTQVLRQEWGLQGYVTSDCDAVAVVYEYIGYASSAEDAVADCLNAGVDLNCGSYVSKHAAAALEKGTLNVSTIDKALSNLFTVRMRLGLFDGDPKLQPFGLLGPDAVCTDSHRQLALEAARQGLVLLKNEARTLPLLTGHINKLAVIGPSANASNDALLGNYAGPPCATVSPLEGLQRYVDVVFEPGCINVTCVLDSSLVQAATEIALTADAVILFAGLDKSQEGEDDDRYELVLPGQQQSLISRVASAASGPVILVILSGGPVDISFARDNSKIQGIIWAGYPGEAGGQAIAELIFGEFSPGGRLPITWYPDNFTEVPMTDMNMRPRPSQGYPGRTHRFYRGDTVFKFGHGLSYMDVSEAIMSAQSEIYLPFCVDHFQEKIRMVNSTPSLCYVPDAQANNNLDHDVGLNVSIRLSNNGRRGGSYTVLLFSKPLSRQNNLPQQQLIDFKRVMLEPNRALDVPFFLDPYKHLSVVNEYGRKVLNVGPHVLMVNDRVQHTVFVKLAGAKKEVCC